MKVMYVDIKLYEYGESNAIGYNRNCFSTTVVLGFTVQVYGVTVFVKS